MGDPFRNRVASNVAPVSAPLRTGSPIGQGLEQLGRAGFEAARDDAQLHEALAQSNVRIELEQRRRDVSAKIATGMGAWADVQSGIETDLDALKSKTPVEEYQAKAEALITERTRGFLSTLGDNPNDPVTQELTERFAPLVATFSASARRSEGNWAVAEKARVQSAGVDRLGDATANRLIGKPAGQDFAAAIGAVDPLIDGMDLTPSQKLQASDRLKQRYARAFLDGLLQQGNHEGVATLLGSGKFDAWLDPEAKVNYLQQADNAAAVAARQADLAASHQRDAVRDSVKGLQAKIEAGIVPAPAELRGAMASARAAGLKGSELIDIGLMSVRADVNRSFGRMVDQPGGADALRTARDQLRAKVAAGTASETEQVMAAQVAKLTDLADEKENAKLKALVDKGPGGQFQALQAIPGSAAARAEKAEKLKPGLGFVANLSPYAQQFALEGSETRKARPKDFGTQDQARGELNRMLGAYAGSLGGQYDDLLNTSWDIMAQQLASRGRSGFDAEAFQASVRLATGGGKVRPGENVVRGGLQTVRGNPVLLPSWSTAGDFDAAMSRQDFAGAVYANGKPVDKGDVLKNYRPEPVGDLPDGSARYGFVDAGGGLLMGKDGRPFTMALPPEGRR
jgi:hypothetical protein